jgi:RHS repeat-associated protein
MKKTIKYMCSFLVAMLSLALGAQTQTENHIVSKTYKVKSQTSLSTNDPNQVTTSIQYFDGLGRAKQSVLVKGGAGGYGNNALPYDWSAGTPTNSGFFNLNGSSTENQIVSGITPFGNTDLLWECIPDASNNADGGWNSDSFDIDNTKAYRYTLWVKRTGSQNGTTYHGVRDNVSNLNGTINTNPYYWQGDLPQLDTWYLVVGYIHPFDYTGADIGISGVYDIDGNKVLDGTEYKWTANSTTKSYFRSYLYYSTDTSVRQYFWSPVVQKMDGSEDSLNDVINNTSVINNEEIVAKDIVTHYEYDGFGRQAKQYLPYASGNTDGRFETSAKEDIQNYYLNRYAVDFPGITDPADVNAFSEQIFENSPLNRPTEQTAPGLAWKQSDVLVTGQEYSDGHTIKFNYQLNDSTEVRYFPVTITVSGDTYIPSLGTQGYYNAGELTKTITKDENWTIADGVNKTTEEFKDKNGQVVLKRTYASVGSPSVVEEHDTYYVYDDYGNLTYVFPPKVDTSDGISAIELSELCYQYVYDYRNRLVEKKIPGKGWEGIVYDKLDRPIMTNDANLIAQKKYLFTKYDALGRVVYTGLADYASYYPQRNAHQISVSNSSSPQYETRGIAAATIGDATLYYTDNSYPNGSNLDEIHTISYYDTYIDLPTGLTPPTLVYDQNVTTNTQGLATVSKVRVLGTNDWITTVTYYDEKARPIYVYSQNDYLQTTDIVESKLDFTGKVLETRTTHSKAGITDDIVTIDRFEYDHMDRLINQSQKVNDLVSERIVRNNYDDLGQLKSKLTGSGVQKGHTGVTSGISISGDEITKTSGSCWGVGLATLGSFQADGYIEFTTEGINKYYAVGLSTSNDNASISSIDYGIYIRYSDEVYVYESGASRGVQDRYAPGDVFRVERIGNKIYYKRNDETFYISEVLSSGSLLGDVSMCHDGGVIKNLHIVDNSKGLQNVDYAYNVRGWLKSINDDAQNDNDLFNFSLRYNDPTSGTALYNGNIAQTHWNSASSNTTGNPVSSSYTYSYDALNRIISGIDNTGNYNLSSVSYDKNGNILTLQRQGHTNAAATLFGMMDNLSYTYDSGNKLTKVDDASGRGEGFKDVSGTDYTYDANGNMKTDGNKGITNILYNHLNLPTQVQFAGQYSSIYYVYDATGVKLEKKVSGMSITQTITEYAGNYVYEKVGSGSNDLQFFNMSEGYVKKDNGDFGYVYQYKDHLGNVRISYSDNSGNGVIEIAANTGGNYTEIIEESNYYPFGLKHEGYNDVTTSNGNALGQKNKMFQGQMLDDELDLNWYGFKYRNYDPSLARFHNIDPLAEDYVYNGTYNFSENRVIDAVELEGLEKWLTKDLDNLDYWEAGLATGFESEDVDGPLIQPDRGGFYSFLDKLSFVAEASAKVTLGAQAGVKAKIGGIMDVKAQFNAINVELFEGKADLTAPLDGDSYTADYLFKGGHMDATSGVAAEVGIFGTPLLGGDFAYSQSDGNPGEFDGGIYAVVPITQTKSRSSRNSSGGDLGQYLIDAMGKKPSGKAKVGKKRKFYGVDIGAAASFILGLEVNFRLGFEVE